MRSILLKVLPVLLQIVLLGIALHYMMSFLDEFITAHRRRWLRLAAIDQLMARRELT